MSETPVPVDASVIGLALGASAVPTALVAVDGTFTWVNDAMCDLLGRDRRTLMRSTWQELTYADDVAVDLALVEDVLAGACESYRLRKRYLRPDGQLLWGDLTVSCLRDDAGGVATFISQIIDVTDRVQSEERVLASERHARLLLENAADTVFSSTVNAVFTWVSPQVIGTLGWTPDEMVGVSAFDLVHPADLPNMEVANAAVQSGRPHTFEVRLRMAKGGYRWVSSMVRPILDDDGVVVGRSGAWREIDDAVTAREELATREEQFRLLAENASDVVAQLGPDRVVVWVSPSVSEALGWDPDDLVGTDLGALLHPEDEALVLTEVNHDPDADGSVVSRVRRADGGWSWMSLRTTSFRSPDGTLDSAVTSLRNVDDLVNARQAARDEERRLHSLIDGLLEPFLLLRAVRDEQGAVVDFGIDEANPIALEQMGLAREDLLATTLLTISPGLRGSDLFARYVDVVDSGESLVLDGFQYQDPDASADEAPPRQDVRAVRVGDVVSVTWRESPESIS